MKWWNPLDWSIPVKLTLGLVLAVGLAVTILVMVARSSFQAYSEQTVRAYLRERGDQQIEQINGSLRAAAQDLNDFVDDRLNQRLVQDALAEDRVGVAGDPLLALLRGFLGRATGFQQVWLVNDQGETLFDYRRSGEATGTVYRSIVESAWEQSLTSFGLGAQRTFAIAPLRYEAGTPVTLTAAVTANFGGDLLGFVVVLLDEEQVFFEYLRSSGSLFPTYGYLVAAGTPNQVLALPDFIDQATAAAADSNAVSQAFRGQSDVASYVISDDEEAIGYYAPVQNPYDRTLTVFAFINEYNLSTSSNPIASLFDASRLFPLIVGLVVVFGLLAVLLNQVITPPIRNLTSAIQGMTRGDFSAPVGAAGRGDEIGQMGAAFLDMRAQVRLLLDNLEARVAARARDFAATQEISRFAATQRSLQTLLDQVVQLIVEQFTSIYHAQVFLLDDDGEYAVLRSSTGEVGQKLLARGHKLAAGSVSMIGQVVDQGQTLVARDASASDIHRKNDLLPETRAELAIPLRLGNRVIGALDVQSKQREAFSPDEIQVLETMADQVAVAIENARLYQESVRRLEEIDAVNRRSTQRAWQEYLNARRARQFTSEAGQSFSADFSDLRQTALERGQIVAGEVTRNQTVPLAVPIILRGQTIGAVEWEFPAGDLDDNRLQLAQELANRLAVSLENARLFEERQRAAERERVVNNIAARLTPQTDIGDILQTAVREIGQALRSPHVSIRLNDTSPEQTIPAQSNGNNGTHPAPQPAQPAMESEPL
jgi:GAF domain-containing protein/HAMP domain-containing protein